MNKIISIAIIVLLTSIPTSSIYSKEQSANNPNTQTIKSQKITIENYSFNPQQVTVPVGTTVIWTNNDDTVHDVIFEKFGSEKLNKGQTFSHVFDAKGAYTYICGIHPLMKGKIIVQ